MLSNVCSSDHFPLALDLWCSPLTYPPCPSITPTPRLIPNPIPRIILRQDILVNFQNALPPIQPSLVPDPETVEQLYDDFGSAIWVAARLADAVTCPRTFPPSSGPVAVRRRKPWFDDECTRLKKEVQKALKACFSSQFEPGDKSRYNSLKKCFKYVVKNQKGLYDRQTIDSFADLSCSTDFWAAVKRLRAGGPNVAGLSVETWNEFCSEVVK